MTREEAAPAFAATIAHLVPIVDRIVAWPALSLRQRTYVTDAVLPEIMASSARAVVFRGSRVVVVHDLHGQHVNPGGRREPGETIEQTARREVLEETGWSLGRLTPLGFHHFQHLGERPEDFPYPWCDFIQPVFVAEAIAYDRRARDRTQIELGSRLTPLGRALRELAPWETALLRVAAAARRS